MPCLGCPHSRPVPWRSLSTRPIYFGSVHTRICPKGHRVVEWVR